MVHHNVFERVRKGTCAHCAFLSYAYNRVMKKHIYGGLTAAILLSVAAPVAFAQTNGGYIRETLRRDAVVEGEARINATTSPVGGDASVGIRATTTIREAGSGLPSGRRAALVGSPSATSTRSTPFASSTRKSPVNAQAAETARLEKRAEIEARIAAKKLAITSDMFTRIAERVGRATQRLEDAATKLAETSTLLRTRTTALSERGADTAAVESILSDVDTRTAALKLTIVGLSEDGELAAASTTPAKAWETARVDFRSVIDEVHAIRALIHDAVAALKEAARALGEQGASAAVSTEGKAGMSGATTTEATTTNE